MAGPFRQVAPGRIQVRDGGGGLSVAGIPFFGAGIAVLLIGFGVIPLTNATDLPSFAWPLLMLMGLAFTAVGGALVFGRGWTTLDSSQRLVIKEWGLLVPMHAQTHRLDDYTSVTLGFKKGDSDASDQYPVSLKSRSGTDLMLTSSPQYVEARARAIDVARHLHFDLEDATTDHPARIAAGQADVSLQHRLRLEHARDEVLPRPAGARSVVSEEAGSVHIAIPTHRMHPIGLALMLAPIAIPFLFLDALLRIFRQSQTPAPVLAFFVGFVILVCGLLPAMGALNAFMRARFGRTTVTVSTTGVRIDERGAWRTRAVAAIDAADILDVDYSATPPHAVSEPADRVTAVVNKIIKAGGITIKTRQGLTTFGRGLEDDEVRYLHSVFRRALTTGRAAP